MKKLYRSFPNNLTKSGFSLLGRRAKPWLVLVVFLVVALAVNAQTTWYTLASGKWTNPDIWTLDPAGAVPVNPSNLVPNATTDNIVIKNGITVSIPDGLAPFNSPVEILNNLNCGILTINGNLDLGVSTGHQFTQIKGNGRIYVEADNFPTSPNITHFISAGQGEGTIVLKGTGQTIDALPAAIYNLEVSLTSGTAILDQNITLNGHLTVATGTLQINSASGDARTMTVSKNITVQAGASFTVGTSNKVNVLNAYGDFKNYGTVDFANSAQYASYGGGELKVYFKGETNNDLVCNGTTDFYRLLLDKGTDDTYTLTVNASNSNNFKLFGPITTDGGIVPEDVDENGDGLKAGYERLALVLLRGTLKLESNINIPRLGENIWAPEIPREFGIPYTAQLWINGAVVASTNGPGGSRGTRLEGKLRVSAGSFTNPNGTGGVSYRGNVTKPGQLIIEGTGVVNTTQLKEQDTNGRFIYKQSGGTLNLTGVADVANISAIMALPQADYVFEMTGGTINIDGVNSITGTSVNGIDIKVDEGNYNVTGGTININTPTRYSGSITDFEIYSNAPLYNLNIVNAARAGTQKVVLNSALTVLNDFTIGASTSFDALAAGNTLSIGGNFTNSGTFTATGNTTRFIGADASNISGSNIVFAGLDVNKNSGVSVGLTGSNGIQITSILNVNSGIFDLGTLDVSNTGNISLYDGTITSSGGEITMEAGSELYSSNGTQNSFGIIRVNGNMALTSDVKAQEFIFSGDHIVDLGSYNLELTNSIYTAAGWSVNRMFKTNGESSDGGLTLPVVLSNATNYGTGTVVQFYPVGCYNATETRNAFNPVYVDARNTPTTTNGKLNIRPVDGAHPTVTDATKVLPFYWRMASTNLGSITNDHLRYRFAYDGSIAGSINKASILFGASWVEIGINKPQCYTNFDATKSYFTGDISMGNPSDFKNPTTYYSKDSGAWNSASTWTSSSTHAGANAGPPTSADIAVIGGASGVNHNVTITTGDRAAQVQIKGKSDTNIGVGNPAVNPPTLEILTTAAPATYAYSRIGGRTAYYYSSGNEFGDVVGNGRILISNIDDLPTSNYEGFVTGNEAIFEYTGNAPDYILPDYSVRYQVNGNRIGPDNGTKNVYKLDEYPNLHFTGTSSKTGANTDLIINGNLYVNNATFNVSTSANGNLNILGDVIVNTGNLVLPNGVTRTLNVEGDIAFTGTGDLRVNTGGTAREHQINLKGGITQANGDIDLSATAYAKVSFIGSESATFSKSGSGTTEFYNIVINKPSDRKVHFTGDFDLLGSTSGATKALTLTSGECHLDNTNIEIDLTSGAVANDFKIPAAATLRVDNGSEVVMTGSGSGMWLDGDLILNNGGELNCDDDNNGTDDGANYIEYSASGNASIYVGANAKLSLGGQLRRATTTDAGILAFNQAASSSTVKIGTVSAATANRGVFEVLGGSTLTQAAGATITLVRPQTAATVPALIINTDVAPSLGAGSSFTLGTATPAGQTFDIYSSGTLENLNVVSNTARVKTGALSLNGSLSIGNGSVFNANGYDLTLLGNITNNGTFTPSGNTTYLSGIGGQSISGTSPTSFYNLVKDNSNTVTFTSADVNVSNDLTISAGTVNTGEFDLNVGRNMMHAGTVLSNGASLGVVFNGSEIQELSGAGTFARMTIDNNGFGVNVPTQSGSINFTERLNLEDGIFDIGRNLIVFDEDATIESSAGFSVNNMVQTNLSFVDNGIKKVFPVVTFPSTLSFKYPIGSLGKYTPIDLVVRSNSNNTGSIRVKAADEHHVSVVNIPNTPVEYDETQNVLQYNWTLDASGIVGFWGEAVMNFIEEDAIVTSGFDVNDYITARILLSSDEWNKFGKSGVNHTLNTLTFGFGSSTAGTNDLGIDGDYTAGIDVCIPNQIPSYISVIDGPWNDNDTWAVYTPNQIPPIGAPGVGVPSDGPKGSIVYIGDNTTVTMPDNFRSAYRTVINQFGEISIGSSIGHRLGEVSGNGKLIVESGTLPAGVYDDFFSANGGTLEYTYTGNDEFSDYSILSEINSLNHLALTGDGIRRLPNGEFSILGNLTIDGPSVVNEHHRPMNISGNIVFDAGSYDAGFYQDASKNATVTLNGTSRQKISGTADFASPNEFFNLVMNNATGMDVESDIEVSNVLTLTNGIINTGAGGSLTITNGLPAAFTGGSTTSYVDGPLRKQINNSSNFTFPVGDNSRYGKVYVATDGSSQGIWEAEYYNHNPLVDGFDPASLSGVAYVSHNEYWRIKAPASGNSANLTMYWDANSGVNPDADFRVVKWTDLTPGAWSSLAINTPTGDATSGSVGLSGNLPFGFNGSNNNHYLTFGSIIIPAFSWEGDNSSDWFTSGNWSGNIVPSAGSNITINNVGNSPVVGEGTLAQANIITMGSGASLTLSPGARMTVNGAITNTGASIVIQNSVDKPSSFMTYGSLSASVSYQWTYPTGKYIYLGHCVDGDLYGNYNSPANSLVYKIVNNAWVQVTNSTGFNANALDGYSVGFKTALGPTTTVLHTGTLRQGNYTYGLGANWYLIANPYATYLDLESSGFEIGADFKSVYVAQSGTGLVTFSTFNVATNVGANGGSRYVAPGQSFWVRNYTGTPTLSINSSARTHATGALKAASIVDDVLRLQVSKGSATDEGVLVFRDFGSESFSGVYDSEKRFATGPAEMSIYTQKDNRKLVINALPDDLDGRVVPLYLNIGSANGGTFTLSATNLGEFMADVDVYLLDKTTGETTNLRDKSSYTFTSAAVSAQNRFELSFAPKVQVPEVPTEVGNTLGDGARITAIGLDNKAIVRVKDASFNGNVTIEVLDALGRLHGRTVSQTARTEVSAPSNTQFFVVKVSYNNRVETFKIVTKMD